MNPSTTTTPTTTTTTKTNDGWLWASAACLGALVLLATTGAFDRPARAEMAGSAGGYHTLTTDGGSDEILVVTDDRSESLLVYQVLSGKKLEQLNRYPLPDLFREARLKHGLP